MVFYIHRLSPLGVLLPAALELYFLSWRGLICVYTWVSTRVKNDNWDDGGGDGGDAEAGDAEDADDGGSSFRKDKCSSVPCSVLHCLRSSPSVFSP